MILLPQSLELSSSALLSPGFSLHHRRAHNPPPMSAAAYFTCFGPFSAIPLFHRHPYRGSLIRKSPLSLRRFLSSPHLPFPPNSAAFSTVEPLQQKHLEDEEEEEEEDEDETDADVETRPSMVEPFSDVSAEKDMRHLSSPHLEVRELEDLPEQWRRSKVAWLCKELPSHKPAGLLRILNAQRKWINQEDATYVALHCMRIRENEAGYRVYKWMTNQRWFRFDFALATKLSDYLGKDRKYTKCREMFDAIISQGRVPSESSFHILTVAYLSAPVQGCIVEACAIYNKMIQLGGYRPRLSLHNSLFRALVSKTGGTSKHHLKQAEFIYHNLVTSELEIHKDVYAGLIWLHSYQDVIDRERIAALREEMRQAGFEESREVLLSIIRASAKEGDVEETEMTWLKLLESGCTLPSQAFVYRMELYAKVGEPMKSLEIFKGMKKQEAPSSVAAYHKIIEVMTKAQEVEIAETLMDEFIESSMKHLMPAFLDLMNMYLKLEMHDRLESTFTKFLARCRPNRSIYNIYLESLVRIGNFEKAEEIFNEIHANGAIGANARSCNLILGGLLASGENVKAEKVYDIMCQKKYDLEPNHLEKLEYALSLKRKVVKRRVSVKLDQEQREILIGLLLGGVRIESDEERRNHAFHFEFSEESNVHSVLKMHIHERLYEWLTSSSRSVDGDNDIIPNHFSTIPHSYFGFFADQFWLKGQPMIPKLIHRWLSARVLAYWYMYGGFRTSSGDILLKLKSGSREDVERIIKTLQAKSLACKMKRKGRVFWIGFQGSNAVWFWKLVEPFVLKNIKDLLAPFGDTTTNGADESQNNEFDIDSDSDEQRSD